MSTATIPVPDREATGRSYTRRVHYAAELQAASTLAAMFCQSLYDQILALAARAGRPGLENRLVTGYGDMAETVVVAVGMPRRAWNQASLPCMQSMISTVIGFSTWRRLETLAIS